MSVKHQLLYWLPVYLYACLIFYFSSISNVPLPEQELGIQISSEIKHVAEYAVLSFLLFRAFNNSKSVALKTNAYLLAITLSIIYGITDELHQFFIPGRQCSILDVFFDGIGSSLILIRTIFK